MENKKKRNKAIIISIVVLIVLALALFLIYKNKDSFGVKTSSVLTRIFSPLETSDNKKKEMVMADEYIYAGDNVSETGLDGNTRKVKRATDDNIFGRAISDINPGEIGEIELSEGINPGEIGEIELLDTGGNSFWNSFSSFLNNTFKFTPACSDKKDNDEDGLADEKDPNCHKGGDLNGEYVPKHFSESESPFDPDLGIDGIDLRADMVSPTSSQINTEVELSSVITNHGNENSQQEINVLFTISDVRDGESSNNIYLATTIPEILAESQGTASVKQLFTNTGVYYIRACADKKDNSDVGLITEAFEENNCGGWTTFTVTNVLPDDGAQPECSDGKDNDADNLIDINDPICHQDGDINGEYLPEYDSESQTSHECNDTIDNDKDGLIDEKDPVCHAEGDLNKDYLPNYDSESILSYACNDTIDNDKDGYIDSLDPNCHEGGNLSKPYKATHDSELESPEEPNICLSLIPITFTDEQEKRLDELLRKFYLLAPNLKSELDVSLVYKEVANQQNFISQVETLTKECYARVDNDPTYEGPKTRYGNPWYHYGDRGSYISENTSSGKTSYCKNDPSKTKPLFFDSKLCATFKNRGDCEGLTKTPNFFLSFGFYYEKTSCTWVETINLQEYETLLNIW